MLSLGGAVGGAVGGSGAGNILRKLALKRLVSHQRLYPVGILTPCCRHGGQSQSLSKYSKMELSFPSRIHPLLLLLHDIVGLYSSFYRIISSFIASPHSIHDEI